MIDFFVKGGALMWPILLCSVVALGLIIAKSVQFWSVLRRLSQPQPLVFQRRPAELAPILDGIEQGLDEKKIAHIGSKQMRSLEKGLGVLSLVAVVAPLLGFTGTVTGMIQAFMVIAEHTGGRVGPSMVAGGIYEALITTACGLFVAIPTHVALHFLEDRLEAIGIRLEDLTLAGIEGRPHEV
ncbi:MAG: flagellar motor protein MotA [Syntrophobacteraceae bacterium CG2_30_61_12]|nr:MAG: flagellar motor protein MotA [Syntrophobacteraceae bacterium CG2_30_61_12]